MKLNHQGSKLREKKKPEPKPAAEKPAAVEKAPSAPKPAAAPAPVETEKKENITNQDSANSAASDNVTKE